MANVDSFMKSSLRNSWVDEPGIAVYVRKSLPRQLAYGIDLHIASLRADEPGSGAFTRLLDRLEKEYGIFVECILNKRLIGFLIDRGYTIQYFEFGAPNAFKSKLQDKACTV